MVALCERVTAVTIAPIHARSKTVSEGAPPRSQLGGRELRSTRARGETHSVGVPAALGYDPLAPIEASLRAIDRLLDQREIPAQALFIRC